VNYLFAEHNIEKALGEEARSWYDSYRVLKDPTLAIYSPWSFMNFLLHNEIQNYWVESSNINFINKLFKIDAIKAMVQSLLSIIAF
jgi:hypothetical protein